ncbi:hypothetical protein ACFLZ6_02490 [Nanoarchaeota archaeon]
MGETTLVQSEGVEDLLTASATTAIDIDVTAVPASLESLSATQTTSAPIVEEVPTYDAERLVGLLSELHRYIEDNQYLYARLDQIREQRAMLREQLPYGPGRELRRQISSLNVDEYSIGFQLKERQSYALANQAAGNIIDELTRLPRSERAENAYERARSDTIEQDHFEAVEGLRDVTPDGNWVYFPAGKSQFRKDYTIRLARVSTATGKPVLSVLHICSTNSHYTVDLFTLTSECKRPGEITQFKDGPQAMKYFMEKVSEKG